MGRRGTFSYTVQAHCPPTVAVGLLADPARQRELHPLIVRVRSRPPTGGALAGYDITDRLPLGPLRFPVTYAADVLRAGPDEVLTIARQRPSTTVRNHTRLQVEPGGLLRIDVEITLVAPAPLFGYAFRQARRAHLALAARLAPALERAAAAAGPTG